MNKYSALGWKKTDKSKVGSEVRCFQAYCGCVGGLRKILRKGGDHIVHTGNKEWARNWLAPPKPEEKSCKTL